MKPIYHLAFQNILKILLFSKANRIKMRYFLEFKKWPNAEDPKTFNEKIIRRMIYEYDESYKVLADKYSVREFVKQIVGEQYLIPLIFNTQDPEELLSLDDWSGCVIKPSHAAGMVKLFDLNPSLEEKKRHIREIKKWLNVDYSKLANEWQYENIPRRILVEKKISVKGVVPRDYKFHCFRQNDSKVNWVMQVIDGRFNKISKGYYLQNFKDCVWHHGAGNHLLDNDEISCLNKIVELNKKFMDQGYKYIRIDWYIENGNIYFGELTFTSGAGALNGFGEVLERKMSEFWV